MPAEVLVMDFNNFSLACVVNECVMKYRCRSCCICSPSETHPEMPFYVFHPTRGSEVLCTLVLKRSLYSSSVKKVDPETWKIMFIFNSSEKGKAAEDLKNYSLEWRVLLIKKINNFERV